jgi:putative ABC transport system substrate-binding protein
LNNRRKLIAALGAGALAAPLVSLGQATVKIWHIGFLSANSPTAHASRVEAVRVGLRELGYVEGKNLVIEYRWAESKYERLPDLAAELVRLKVDVIVTHGSPAIRAARAATKTIPIVMASSGEAVSLGFVSSLARPGGNVTGSTFFITEYMTKRLELLKEAMPTITRAGALVNPDSASTGPIIRAMEVAAKTLKLELHRFDARGPDEFERVFDAMAKRQVQAFVFQPDITFVTNPKTIADLALKFRLGSAGGTGFPEAGGLIGFSDDNLALYHRAAYFVDRILKGTKPADLPVEQPMTFALVVNLKTAKLLGLTIPPEIMVQATRVIQ